MAHPERRSGQHLLLIATPLLLFGAEQWLLCLWSVLSGTPLVLYYSGVAESLQTARMPWATGPAVAPWSADWWLVTTQALVCMLVGGVPLLLRHAPGHLQRYSPPPPGPQHYKRRGTTSAPGTTEDDIWRQWSFLGLLRVLLGRQEPNPGTSAYCDQYRTMHRRHACIVLGSMVGLLVVALHYKWFVAAEDHLYVFVGLAVGLVFTYFLLVVANARCPACRAGILQTHTRGILYVPTVCPKCDTRLW